MLCLLILIRLHICAVKLLCQHLFSKVEFLTRKVVSHLLNYGKVTLLMRNVRVSCVLIQVKGNFDLKLLMASSLDMLIIVLHIDSLYWKVMLDYNKMKQNLQSFLKILFLRVEKASSSPLVSTISENDISRNDTLELRSKRQIKEFSFEKWILHIHCCWGTIKLHWSNFFSLQWVLKKRHSTWKCFFFSK